jgi:hypothetical protein
MEMLGREAVVTVMPLTRQQEGDEVIIGRPETGVFLAIPREAAELLDQLAQGKSLGEISDLYQQKYGETPDLNDFVSLLESKGLVALSGASNGGTGAGANVPQPPKQRFHFSDFPERLAQRLFGRSAVALYFLVIALAVAAICRDPWIMPVPADLVFPDHRTMTWTVLIALSYAGVFVHELSHLIAARAVGINSRMGISHRLWYLVAETDLTGLWAVPKRQRYLPMLAGMLIDSTSAALLILLLFVHGQEWLVFSSFWVRLVRALAFSYLLGITWQFFLFVRTDLYYVIANLLNCRNLLGDTQDFLRNQLARIRPSISYVDQSNIPLSERRAVHIYAVLWVAGRVWAFSVLLSVTLPVGLSYIRNLGATFKAGYFANPSDFIDAFLVAAYFIVPMIAGFTLWIGALARRERTWRWQNS